MNDRFRELLGYIEKGEFGEFSANDGYPHLNEALPLVKEGNEADRYNSLSELRRCLLLGINIKLEGFKTEYKTKKLSIEELMKSELPGSIREARKAIRHLKNGETAIYAGREILKPSFEGLSVPVPSEY